MALLTSGGVKEQALQRLFCFYFFTNEGGVRQASAEQRNINGLQCHNSSDVILLSVLLKGRPAFANKSVLAQCDVRPLCSEEKPKPFILAT